MASASIGLPAEADACHPIGGAGLLSIYGHRDPIWGPERLYIKWALGSSLRLCADAACCTKSSFYTTRLKSNGGLNLVSKPLHREVAYNSCTL